MLTIIINVIKGLVLGCTAVTPGISVGTSAVVLRVFEPAIEFLSALFSPRAWNRTLLVQGLLFFIPTAVGFITAMIFFAGVLLYFFESTPILLILVFCGLICTTIPFFAHEHITPRYSWWHVCFVVCGFMLLFFLTGTPETTKIQGGVVSAPVFSGVFSGVFFGGELLRAFFVGGMLSAAVGLIPGLSGSYILLLIGYYPTFLAIVDNAYLPLFIPLLIGSVVGLITMSIALKYIIRYFPAPFYACILGLLIGTLYYFVRFYLVPYWGNVSGFAIFIFFSLGSGLALLVELLTRKTSLHSKKPVA